jgi:hypothetical protein
LSRTHIVSSNASVIAPIRNKWLTTPDSLWIGAIKATNAAEPFLFYLPTGAVAPNLQFLSYHAYDFNSAVNAFVWIGQSLPVQFIELSQSSELPTPGASTFAMDRKGYLIQSGDNHFYGCRNETTPENSYELFWLDYGIPAGYNCTGRLYLTTSLGCTTDG